MRQGPFSVEHQIVEAGQPDLETRTTHENCCYSRHVAVIKTEFVSSILCRDSGVALVFTQTINFVEYTQWRAAGTSGYSPI